MYFCRSSDTVLKSREIEFQNKLTDTESDAQINAAEEDEQEDLADSMIREGAYNHLPEHNPFCIKQVLQKQTRSQLMPLQNISPKISFESLKKTPQKPPLLGIGQICSKQIFDEQIFVLVAPYLPLASLLALTQTCRRAFQAGIARTVKRQCTIKICRGLDSCDVQAFVKYIVKCGEKSKKEYMKLCTLNCDCEDQIERDVNRTFDFDNYDLQDDTTNASNTKIQEMQSSLTRVLKALSHSIREVGYIQGWHSICGVMIRSKCLEEYQIYALFNYLMHRLQFKDIYKDNFERIKVLNLQLLQHLKIYLRPIYEHFSFKTILLFGVLGWKVLIKLALSLLSLFQTEILSIEDTDELNQFLKNFVLEKFLSSQMSERALLRQFARFHVKGCNTPQPIKSLEHNENHFQSLLRRSERSAFIRNQNEQKSVFQKIVSLFRQSPQIQRVQALNNQDNELLESSADEGVDLKQFSPQVVRSPERGCQTERNYPDSIQILTKFSSYDETKHQSARKTVRSMNLSQNVAMNIGDQEEFYEDSNNSSSANKKTDSAGAFSKKNIKMIPSTDINSFLSTPPPATVSPKREAKVALQQKHCSNGQSPILRIGASNSNSSSQKSCNKLQKSIYSYELAFNAASQMRRDEGSCERV